MIGTTFSSKEEKIIEKQRSRGATTFIGTTFKTDGDTGTSTMQSTMRSPKAADDIHMPAVHGCVHGCSCGHHEPDKDTNARGENSVTCVDVNALCWKCKHLSELNGGDCCGSVIAGYLECYEGYDERRIRAADAEELNPMEVVICVHLSYPPNDPIDEYAFTKDYVGPNDEIRYIGELSVKEQMDVAVDDVRDIFIHRDQIIKSLDITLVKPDMIDLVSVMTKIDKIRNSIELPDDAYNRLSVALIHLAKVADQLGAVTMRSTLDRSIHTDRTMHVQHHTVPMTMPDKTVQTSIDTIGTIDACDGSGLGAGPVSPDPGVKIDNSIKDRVEAELGEKNAKETGGGNAGNPGNADNPGVTDAVIDNETQHC